MSSPLDDSKPGIKFYSPKRPKYAPGEPAYERLSQMFKEKVDITEIARRLGVSRDHVRQLRAVYFTPKFPRLANDRRKKILDSVFVNCILPILTARGDDCEFADNDVREVRINGHKCRFYKASNASFLSLVAKSRHTTVNFKHKHLLSYKFLIVFQTIGEGLKRIYVIPADVILDNFSFCSFNECVRIRLPVEGTTGYNKARVIWTEYLDAWDLLKAPVLKDQKSA